MGRCVILSALARSQQWANRRKTTSRAATSHLLRLSPGIPTSPRTRAEPNRPWHVGNVGTIGAPRLISPPSWKAPEPAGVDHARARSLSAMSTTVDVVPGITHELCGASMVHVVDPRSLGYLSSEGASWPMSCLASMLLHLARQGYTTTIAVDGLDSHSVSPPGIRLLPRGSIAFCDRPTSLSCRAAHLPIRSLSSLKES
jgi:hypothetical protein